MRQDADGQGYIGFFEAPYGFAWSGRPEEPVEVTHGGTGEPVIATFHLNVASGKPADVIERFVNACRLWLADGSDT